MTEVLMTGWFRFLGMNIKGTPAMRYEKVAEDLEVAKVRADVVVVQEFRWTWYWKALKRVLRPTKADDSMWRASPGFLAGSLKPVRAAQAAFWRSSMWQRRKVKVRLLHKGRAGISENRYIRAVLLKDKVTGLKCWFLTTHYVVGGNEPRDPQERRDMLAQDLRVTNRFLAMLVETGHPVMGQLDANIRPGFPSYDRFVTILDANDARIIGHHGVEFLFVIDGKNAKVEVKKDWIVKKDDLNTDHEGRGCTARLVATGK